MEDETVNSLEHFKELIKDLLSKREKEIAFITSDTKDFCVLRLSSVGAAMHGFIINVPEDVKKQIEKEYPRYWREFVDNMEKADISWKKLKHSLLQTPNIEQPQN